MNFLRDEPGGRRFFVNDLNGPLYIVDKQTKRFTTYLDFNGAGGRTGLFRRLTFERNFATGLINFCFDPDYTRNGVFYTLHMEDPTINAEVAPRPGAIAGLDLSGYTTTSASLDARRGSDRSRGRTDRVDRTGIPRTRRSRARRGSCCACSSRSPSTRSAR